MGKYPGYFKNRQNKVNYPNILTSADHKIYAVEEINGKKKITDEELEKFYLHHRWDDQRVSAYAPNANKKLTPQEKQERLIKSAKTSKLLGIIQDKFGGINDQAEGSKELEELRALVGAKE